MARGQHRRKEPSLVIWRGPSVFDGRPIRVVLSPHSRNIVTGDMAQVFILPDDVNPMTAIRTREDRRVCGDCLLRPGVIGGCYVNVWDAVRGVWAATRHADTATASQVWDAVRRRPIRIGAYGDPAAMPRQVFDYLVAVAHGRVTSYTHGHLTLGFDGVEHLRRHSMLSVESEGEALRAWQRGWRTFRILGPDDRILPEEMECPYDTLYLTCYDCLLCRGGRARGKSIAVRAHGRAVRRALRVVQGC